MRKQMVILASVVLTSGAIFAQAASSHSSTPSNVSGTGAGVSQEQPSVKTLIFLGNQYYGSGQYDAALVAFRRAVTAEPGSVDALYGLGQTQLKLSLFDLALSTLKKVISINPQFVPGYVALSQVYTQTYLNAANPAKAKDNLKLALSVLASGAKANPKYYAIYNQEGLIYQYQSNLNKAVQAFQQALSINDQDPIVLYNLALTRLAQGKMDAAMLLFQRAVAVAPQDAFVRTRYGALLAVKGQLDQALFQLEQATRLDPKSAMAWSYLGQVQFQLKQYATAESALGKAIQIDPVYQPEAYLYLGRSYYVQGDYTKANYNLTKAAVLDSGNAAAHYWLGMSAEKLGNQSGACAQYKAALKIEPDDTAVSQAAKRLKCP